MREVTIIIIRVSRGDVRGLEAIACYGYNRSKKGL